MTLIRIHTWTMAEIEDMVEHFDRFLKYLGEAGVLNVNCAVIIFYVLFADEAQ